MANEQFIDPTQPGPFIGLPLTTALRTNPSPWGSLASWGYGGAAGGLRARVLMDPDYEMRQYALTSVAPTTRTEVTRTGVIGQAQNVAPFQTYGPWVAFPIHKSVIKFTSGGTIGAATLITGGFCFSCEMKDDGYSKASPTSIGNFYLIPMCAYIWRPSTQALVAYLWDASCNATTEADWGYAAALNLSNARPTRPYMGLTATLTTGAGSPPAYFVNTAKANASVTFLADDYLVIETWGAQAAYAGAATDLWNVSFKVSIGGTVTKGDGGAKSELTDPAVRPFFRFVPPVAYSAPTPGGAYTGVPNLTNVDPQTGPELRLTFDGPVTANPPTFGPAASGVGATGATQVSDRIIDLALALKPDAIEGDAAYNSFPPPVGEADVAGPPVPTGIGAEIV